MDATIRVIGRAGVAGVSQRVVAAEADVPASAVAYYFPTVDDLLLTVLTDVNDGYVAALRRCAEAPDPVEALADLIAATGRPDARPRAAAEFELFMLAGRGERWQREYERWTAALASFLDPVVAGTAHAQVASAAVDGLFVRAYCLPGEFDAERIRAVLRSLGDA